MYSYEDRIRAVELYIKLGMRVRPTIRQLGYPNKNALKGWHLEYQQRQGLATCYASRELLFWAIEMLNDDGELTCVSRLTMAMLAPRD